MALFNRFAAILRSFVKLEKSSRIRVTSVGSRYLS